MSDIGIRGAAMAAIATVTLAGCSEGLGPLTTDKSVESANFADGEVATRTEIRDVERPDIFSAQDTGLWDGRPSLGGIWVAHPDVDGPARALITNEKTGQTVAGALFRRERETPGPRIQVSSDAATELEILAGQPTNLSIVVVQQEEVQIEVAPPAGALSDEIPGEDIAAEEVAPDTSDIGAEAVAVASASAAIPEAIVDGTIDASMEAAPARPNFWQRFRNSLKRNPPAEEAFVEELGTVPLDETLESASAPTVETATLDPIASVAAAAIDEAEAEPAAELQSTLPETLETETVAAVEPTPAPVAAPQPAGLRNPFIQVGLFSVEGNANSAAQSLRQEGIIPTVDRIDRGEVTLWRVLIGPLTSAEDQEAMFTQIKDLGYRDAFLAPS